jgi:GAF domain-containing protein
MLADPQGELRLVASSSEQMRVLELFELQHAEGPCLDAFRTGVAVSAEDIAEATRRWPRFAPEVADAGFVSMHAVPMRLRSQTIGAVNLFRTVASPWSTADLAIAQALADVATIGVLQQRAMQESATLALQLQRALNTRLTIEQAKGLLSERLGVGVDESFTRLRDYARSHNLLLSDVAAALVDGTLPREAFGRARGH